MMSFFKTLTWVATVLSLFALASPEMGFARTKKSKASHGRKSHKAKKSKKGKKGKKARPAAETSDPTAQLEDKDNVRMAGKPQPKEDPNKPAAVEVPAQPPTAPAR